MTSTRWMIVLDDGAWQLVELGDENTPHDRQTFSSDNVADRTAEIAAALRQLGCSGEAALLALDSAWCLAAGISTKSGSPPVNRQAMNFQLEECLPWEAEETVADFVAHDHEIFAVAVHVPQLKPWLDGLESQGVLIESISPTTLLGLTRHVAAGGWPANHMVVWSHADGVDLILVRDGRPSDWRVVRSPSQAAFIRLVQVLALERTEPLDLVGYGLDAELADTLSAADDITFHAPQDAPTMIAAAAETAREVLVSRHDPWIELRRDALALQDRWHAVRGRLNVALAAAAVLLIALSVSFVVRAHRFDRQSDRAAEQLVGLYQQVFPGQAIPAGIRSRLESELAKLKGVRGDSQELPAPLPATDVLYHALASLPPGLRFHIQEIRIDEGRLDVNGQVRNHADVDQIATALREHGFEVSSPSTERASDNRVSVRITARLNTSSNSTVDVSI